MIGCVGAIGNWKILIGANTACPYRGGVWIALAEPFIQRGEKGSDPQGGSLP